MNRQFLQMPAGKGCPLLARETPPVLSLRSTTRAICLPGIIVTMLFPEQQHIPLWPCFYHICPRQALLRSSIHQHAGSQQSAENKDIARGQAEATVEPAPFIDGGHAAPHRIMRNKEAQRQDTGPEHAVRNEAEREEAGEPALGQIVAQAEVRTETGDERFFQIFCPVRGRENCSR